MRVAKFSEINGYDQVIVLNVEKINCSCQGFSISKLRVYKNEGVLTPCKHVLAAATDLQFSEEDLKIVKRSMIMNGADYLTEKYKEMLRSMVNFTCEGCGKTEKEVGILQPHRIVRGDSGGKYVPHNILMKCDGCHKTMHQKEFVQNGGAA